MAERWIGGAWSIEKSTTPKGATGGELDGVSCTTSASCIAVGSSFERSSGLAVALAERWNGHGWLAQKVPRPAGAAASELSSVSCSSKSACTAVGDVLPRSGNPHTLAERWDGTRWRIEKTPSPYGYAELEGVSCPAPNACTAVGIGWKQDGTRTPVAIRWRGAGWFTQRLPRPQRVWDSGLNDVSCTSADACTAVGWALSSDTLADAPPPIERWNGLGWSLQPTPNMQGGVELQGVSCPSLTACTTVGLTSGPPVAEMWDGKSWSSATLSP